MNTVRMRVIRENVLFNRHLYLLLSTVAFIFILDYRFLVHTYYNIAVLEFEKMFAIITKYSCLFCNSLATHA